MTNRFHTDIPLYPDVYHQGRLPLDEKVTRRGRLADLNDAFRAMKAPTASFEGVNESASTMQPSTRSNGHA